MDYQETISFLYNSFPMFEKTGGDAYNPGLSRTEELCAHFGNPQQLIKSVHIAGTNGKGSSSHLIASVMQAAGYKTGLYTSPHLKEFTERIKINGEEISKEAITSFVNEHLEFFKNFNASFFEITTVMAFYFFAKEKVDIAIIETGLGGRLDSTNVIKPELSLITNISFDHVQYLGNTLEKIAFEKAGIIKQGIPIVISEQQEETRTVFALTAKLKAAEITYAEDLFRFKNVLFSEGKMVLDVYNNNELTYKGLKLGLGGFYQEKNIKGVLAALTILTNKGWAIHPDHIRKGFEEVIAITGLKGRWQILQTAPLVIADTAHNEAGLNYIIEQLKTVPYKKLSLVLGMVNDKDVEKILSILPKEAYYYFTQPSIPRALAKEVLYEKAIQMGLKGELIATVAEALTKAKINSTKEDLIYVGGSTFVVAEII